MKVVIINVLMNLNMQFRVKFSDSIQVAEKLDVYGDLGNESLHLVKIEIWKTI